MSELRNASLASLIAEMTYFGAISGRRRADLMAELDRREKAWNAGLSSEDLAAKCERLERELAETNERGLEMSRRLDAMRVVRDEAIARAEKLGTLGSGKALVRVMAALCIREGAHWTDDADAIIARIDELRAMSEQDRKIVETVRTRFTADTAYIARRNLSNAGFVGIAATFGDFSAALESK